MNVFEFRSYKEFLKRLIQSNPERGYQAQLARASGCQPSYLSQVLNGKADLTQDQIIALAEFVGLDEAETEFLLALVLLSRSVRPETKRFLEKKIERSRNQRRQLTERISTQAPLFSGKLESVYHSSWTWGAVHVATAVPDLQRAEALAEHFHLPLAEINRILATLEKAGLVRREKDQWIYATGASHLPEDSALTEINHMMWRHKSVANLSLRRSQDLRYSSVFALSREDAEKLREQILVGIEKARKLIGPSEPEITMALLFDCFVV